MGVTTLAVIGYLGLWGFLAETGVLGVAFWRTAVFVDEHHQAERYDSKLTDERMVKAREEYIREVRRRTGGK